MEVRAERAPDRQPSKPDAPSLPKPATTRPSGSAPSSRSVRPAWFSKPASVSPAQAAARAGRRRSCGARPRPCEREEPDARAAHAVAVAVEATEQLIAAADREERGAALDGLARARRALPRDRGRQRLLAVLAAADVEEVERRRATASPRLDRARPRARARARRAARRARRCCRGRRRCSGSRGRGGRRGSSCRPAPSTAGTSPRAAAIPRSASIAV